MPIESKEGSTELHHRTLGRRAGSFMIFASSNGLDHLSK